MSLIGKSLNSDVDCVLYSTLTLTQLGWHWDLLLHKADVNLELSFLSPNGS